MACELIIDLTLALLGEFSSPKDRVWLTDELYLFKAEGSFFSSGFEVVDDEDAGEGFIYLSSEALAYRPPKV